MLEMFESWVPDFSVWMVAENVAPLVVGGFFLGGVFWLAGFLVDALLAVMRGGFYWTR